jgi:hypothetical protein
MAELRNGGGINMTLSKKVELIGGVATLCLTAAITTLLLRIDYQTALRLDQDYPLILYLSIAGVRFLIPGFLVALGSYVHAVKQYSWGRVMLLIGGPFLIIMFLVNAFVSLSFRRTDILLLLNLLLLVAAIVSLIGALIPRPEE